MQNLYWHHWDVSLSFHCSRICIPCPILWRHSWIKDNDSLPVQNYCFIICNPRTEKALFTTTNVFDNPWCCWFCTGAIENQKTIVILLPYSPEYLQNNCSTRMHWAEKHLTAILHDNSGITHTIRTPLSPSRITQLPLPWNGILQLEALHLLCLL